MEVISSFAIKGSTKKLPLLKKTLSSFLLMAQNATKYFFKNEIGQ